MSKKILSVVAVAGLASAASAQLYSNGGPAELSSGVTAANGTPNPLGEWSECGHDEIGLTKSATAGASVSGVQFRIGDDFTVPAGETWNITQITLYGYQTNGPNNSINNVNIQLWDTDPTLGGTPAQGNTTTNVLSTATASPTGLFRTFNSATVGGCGGTAPSLAREIQEMVCSVNWTVGEGTHWLDWAYTGTGTSGPWSPQLVVVPTGSGTTVPGANGLQSNTGVWGAALFTTFDGNGGTCVTLANVDPAEFPFIIDGTISGGGCEPDLTTGAIAGQPGYGVPNGILNNDDFFYYLAQFAAGNLAVADLTTGAIAGQPGYGVPNGVINNDDFFYYLAIFAAGC
ncbi:MAG: GC-type dockerin domain-anchored protein [Phycisphaerales bacterium]